MAETAEHRDATAIGPEVRIGLVLYGGVSLAIYMYGVVFEVWRLVRASHAIEAGAEEARRERETNPWVDVLAQANVNVKVDLISGASAGGLNGILLGKALVDGSDLRVAETIWLKVADIGELLHPLHEGKPTSVLLSKNLRRALLEGLGKMGSTPKRLADVFDLFISTTHLEGHLEETTDDLDSVLPTKRHRFPVNLRLRDRAAYAAALGEESPPPGAVDRNDFGAQDDELLTSVGAATSAFPVAFEPEEVTEARADALERRGITWPAGHYSDGGILDNKPYTEILGTTFARAANFQAERWLISVDPDMQPPEAADGDMDFIDVAAATTVGIPRYESIAEDLQRLRDRNAEAQAVWDAAWHLEAELAEGAPAGSGPSFIRRLVGGADEEGEATDDARYRESRRRALVSYLVRSGCGSATRRTRGRSSSRKRPTS